MARPAIVHALTAALLCSCVPTLKGAPARDPQLTAPATFRDAPMQEETAALSPWRGIFGDPNLAALIDLALDNNQELHILTQEITIAKAEASARTGEYLPSVTGGVGAGVEKVGLVTSQGVNDEMAGVPEHLQDYFVGLFAVWEVDIWNRLRSAKKAAVMRYLATVEGRQFAVTKLIAEIASSYYELVALDNQLGVLRSNIELQAQSLETVRFQKEAARVTELAVQRFEAEILKNQSREFDLQQEIFATENRINFLVGRFPQTIARSSEGFAELAPQELSVGSPAKLLENRPDVRKAELGLAAAKLDVKSARASFYPSLGLSAGLGYQSFRISDLLQTPASLFYNVSADLLAPLINRRALIANYEAANAMQMRAVLGYEQALLQAVVEVSTQAARMRNLAKSYELKSQQVDTLKRSIETSTSLFQSARADYLEILTTRQEALESQMELIETKREQLLAMVNLYQALGGGWR